MDNKLIRVLTKNAIKCLMCNTILESKHRHDFQRCNCSNGAFVDGGRVYSRVSGKDFNLIENLCEYKEYTKFEYDSLQQERKEQQRISNEQGVVDGKLVKLGEKYYDLKAIDLLLSKGVLDNALYSSIK